MFHQCKCSDACGCLWGPKGWHSQLGDVAGDALGQGTQVLVAAAHDRLQAGTLAGALGTWYTAGILLACRMRERGREGKKQGGVRVTKRK